MTTPAAARRRLPGREDGAVALTVAAGLTALLVVTAMVLDFGLVRLDRQQVRRSADNAVMAGLIAADDDTGRIHSFRAVCAALDFLKTNEPTLAGLPGGPDCSTTSPNWTRVCNPDDATNPLSLAAYTGAVTSNGVTSTVTIKLPYALSEGGFSEESLGSVSGDSSVENNCDQLGLIVERSRKPGLGSLATNSDLVTRLRTVGRVEVSDGDVEPALLLLERTGCTVLTVGSAGSPSRIRVYGAGPSPGTIHSDSTATGSDCGSGSNSQLIQGKQADGIVAYASATGVPGTVSSVATQNGVAANVVSDGIANVYGTSAPSELSSGTTTTVQGRLAVRRRPVDERYLSGVTQVSLDAYQEWQKNPSAPTGYTRFGCPSNADMVTMAAMTAGQSVYIDCNGNSGITLNGTIGAGRIYFHGFVKNGKLRMPNATEVYIDNTSNTGSRVNSDAITIGTGDGFCVRATACDSLGVGACSPAPTGITAQARLVVRQGALTTGGSGLLRLCNTQVLLQGGQTGNGTSAQPGGCLPLSYAVDTPPTSTPCPGSPGGAAGDGLLDLSGHTDWIAPNRYGDMVALGMTRSAQRTAWRAGEDLALWTETYGSGSTFKMSSGNLMIRGVFSTFNAHPFSITGNGAQDLRNAQFITRSFAVSGGATLSMQAPADAIPIPDLGPFLLVR